MRGQGRSLRNDHRYGRTEEAPAEEAEEEQRKKEGRRQKYAGDDMVARVKEKAAKFRGGVR